MNTVETAVGIPTVATTVGCQQLLQLRQSLGSFPVRLLSSGCQCVSASAAYVLLFELYWRRIVFLGTFLQITQILQLW